MERLTPSQLYKRYDELSGEREIAIRSYDRSEDGSQEKRSALAQMDKLSAEIRVIEKVMEDLPDEANCVITVDARLVFKVWGNSMTQQELRDLIEKKLGDPITRVLSDGLRYQETSLGWTDDGDREASVVELVEADLTKLVEIEDHE